MLARGRRGKNRTVKKEGGREELVRERERGEGGERKRKRDRKREK